MAANGCKWMQMDANGCKRLQMVFMGTLLKEVFLFSFHSETLRLYGAVCSHGNNRVAHELTKHIDEKQLMYLIQAPYLSGKRVRVWNIKLDNGLFQRMVGESSFNSANSFIILLKSYGPLFIN